MFFCTTSMWMQPAPAHHLGPMRMGLREPVGIYPLCRVASHALFGPWMTQRIATGCRTDGLYQYGPEAQAESSETPGNITSSRGWRPPRPRRIRMAHAPSRIPPARHIRLADHAHETPGSNRPLSRMAVTPGGNKSSALARKSR